MFIRKTATRSKATSETYFTYRLVASERVGKQVRQITLLNLGRFFDLPQADWPHLCARIEALLNGQGGLLAGSDLVEKMAQRYAARLIALRAASPHTAPPGSAATPPPCFVDVDVNSLELIRPRSVGVEAVGLAAFSWLGFDRLLAELGFNGVQRAAVAASVIGRMAAPGSELSTWRWVRDRSALGELLGVDFEAMPLARLYRTADLLVRHREAIEQALFSRVQGLFGLTATVTLYDLTNTHFEGSADDNPRAARGHSKQKRSDCKLVTLGLVLDGSGFVRRSRLFDGNVAEAGTLQDMLEGLGAPQDALVVMDAGIATAANIAWLVARKFRYLVVSRERARHFDPEQATDVLTASAETVRLQRVVSEDGQEVRLYCHSEGREAKERAITDRFAKRFEAGLTRLAEGLTKPRGQKDLAAIQQRIGELKKSSRGIAQHYEVTVVPDDTGSRATAITWTRAPVAGSMLTDPGVYCLRSTETSWDAPRLWRTYITLTDLEAVFRSLKSELGLRPVFHHTADRTDSHLFITVLAYQLVQVIRSKLAAHQQTLSWTSLRDILAVQQRVTATFRQRDGRVLHVRKATVAEPELRNLYDALGINPAPGGVQKHAI